MSELSTKAKEEDYVVWTVGSIRNWPSWLNFSFVLASAWFIGLFLLYGMYQYTDIHFFETIKWLFLFALAFTMIPYKLVLKVITIDYSHLLALNLIGFGPFFTGMFLLLNFVFASQTTINTYAIVDTMKSVIPFENSFIFIDLEDGALKDQRKFRRFDVAYLDDFKEADSITYTISKGLFGYDVLNDYELK